MEEEYKKIDIACCQQVFVDIMDNTNCLLRTTLSTDTLKNKFISIVTAFFSRDLVLLGAAFVLVLPLLPTARNLISELLLFCKHRSVRNETFHKKDSNNISQRQQAIEESFVISNNHVKVIDCESDDSLSNGSLEPSLEKVPPHDKMILDHDSDQKRKTINCNISEANFLDQSVAQPMINGTIEKVNSCDAPSQNVQDIHRQQSSQIQKQGIRDNNLSDKLAENNTIPYDISTHGYQSSLAILAVHSLLDICDRNDISTAKPLETHVQKSFSSESTNNQSDTRNFNESTASESFNKKRKLSCQSSLTVTAVFSLLEICSQRDSSTPLANVNYGRDSFASSKSKLEPEINVGNNSENHESSRKRRRLNSAGDSNGITKAACVLSSMKETSPEKSKATSNSNIERDDVYALLSLKQNSNGSNLRFDTILDRRPYSTIVRQPILGCH